MIRDLVYGTYTIEEVGTEGYVVEYAGTPATVYVDNQRATILITNTYIVPLIDITATKVWSGGDAANRPVISFQLYRQRVGSELDPVAYGDPVPIAAPATTAFWADVPKTDANRNPYVYTVREVEAPNGYTVSGEGTAGNDYTITNTYVIPKTDVKVTKVWQGGAAPRPTVQFQLYRDGVAVSEADGGVVGLASGTTDYTWRNLDATDVNANEYVYTVKEIVPASWDYNLVSSTGDAATGFTFTNRYISPLRDYTVFKEWVGGDAENRPIVTIQLYRDGDVYLDPIQLPSEDTVDPWRYTWADLDLTDFNGVPYTYHSRETTTTDPRYQPSHADAADDQSTTVTNSFEPELMDVTATKIWIGGASPKPPVMLELYRVREGSTAEPELVRGPSELASGQTTYVWKDLECT